MSFQLETRRTGVIFSPGIALYRAALQNRVGWNPAVNVTFLTFDQWVTVVAP